MEKNENLSRGRGIITTNKEFLNNSIRFKRNKIIVFAAVLIGLALIFSISMGGVSAVTVNDTHKPTVSSVDPVNNAVSISTSKVVKITFSEAVKKGNMWIEFKNSNGKSVQFTSNLTGKKLYLKPKSQLAHNTLYTVVLHSGSVKDRAGNGLGVYSTKFTTIKPIKTYSGNGVTFNYPASWNVGFDYQNGVNYIYGTKYFSSISPQFQLQIERNPSGLSDQNTLESIIFAEYPSGFKVISRQMYTLNGNKVYGLIYTMNTKYYPVVMETKEINIVKNHKIYTMDLTAPQKTFANQKIDFNIIAQSLKIQ